MLTPSESLGFYQKMERGSILAHRGCWSKTRPKNSLDAISCALDSGYGLETDIRDLDGEIVISHDPPCLSDKPIALEFFFHLVKAAPAVPSLALNIKADGLAAKLAKLITSMDMDTDQTFVFDMSIPDTLDYLNRGVSFYSRVSEIEPATNLQKNSTGVWVDSFYGLFPQVQEALKLLQKGYRVTIVSPELHNRNHREVWRDVKRHRLHHNPLFGICTDFPLAAFRYFGLSANDD